MSNSLSIKTLRQRRAIAELLEGPVSVKDLGPRIGALNQRQIILELRRQGFEGIIETRRFTVRDQDGRICRPGEYFIPIHLKPIVREALMNKSTQVRIVHRSLKHGNKGKN